MFDKMKQLMEMKRQAEQIKRELEGIRIDSNAVPGINIVINGSQNFQSIDIDPTLLKAENKKRFEQDLLRSVNAAVIKSQQMAASKMKDMMPPIPGLS